MFQNSRTDCNCSGPASASTHDLSSREEQRQVALSILASTNLPKGDFGLPEKHTKLVADALSATGFLDFTNILRELVKLGGADSVKALASILEHGTSEVGPLASLAVGGRHVTVYTICGALLAIAGVRQTQFSHGCEPEVHLSSEERREVTRGLTFLAKGEHGDAEVARGARAALFERFTSTPWLGRPLDVALSVVGYFHPQREWGAVKALFFITDLPWAFRSKLPFATYDSSKSNLADILSRKNAGHK